MYNPLQFILGPELLWGLFYLSILGLIRFTRSPVKRMDTFWMTLPHFVPFIAIPLTFALFHFPGIEPDWLLLRIWITGLLGAHFVLDRGLNAHSQQGPGVGTAYIAGILFTIFMLLVGSVYIAIKF